MRTGETLMGDYREKRVLRDRIAELEAENARLWKVFGDDLALFLFKQNFHPDERESVAVEYWKTECWPEDIKRAKNLASALWARAALAT